jgi:hypothetical protein
MVKEGEFEDLEQGCNWYLWENIKKDRDIFYDLIAINKDRILLEAREV